MNAKYIARLPEIQTGLADENEVYLTATGGFNSKGRVFGTREIATTIWDPPQHRSQPGDNIPVVQPGVLTRYARENASLKQKVSDLEAQSQATATTQGWLLEKLKEQYGWTPPDQTCTPGPNPHSRDDFFDGGDSQGFESPPVH